MAAAEGERPLTSVVPSYKARTDRNQRGAVARAACLHAEPPSLRQRAQARCARHAAAGLELKAAASASHHGRAPNESGLSLVRHPSWGLEHPQPARRGARVQQARMPSLLPRDSERRRGCARLTRSRQFGVRGRSWQVAPWPRIEEERPVTSVVFSYKARTDRNQRGAVARAACLRAEPPSLRQRAQARCARHAAAGLVLEAAASASHYGGAPNESGLSPVRHPSWGLEHPQPARRGARAQQARMLSVLPRDSERRRACARLARSHRSNISGRSWHIAPRPCTKGERPLAGAAYFMGLG